MVPVNAENSPSVSTEKALTNSILHTSMRRRRLLALLGTAPLAGCTGMPKDAIVKTEQKPAPEATSAISFSELPEEEQDILLTAINEEYYHACPPLPEAVSSFASRVEGDESRLEYEGNQYALWVRIQDQVYATSTSPPENDPLCLF